MLGICFCNDTVFNVAILFIAPQLILVISYRERILCLLPWSKSDNAVIKLQILQKYSKTPTFKSSLKSFLQGLNVLIISCATQMWISLIAFITRMDSQGITNVRTVIIRQMCSHCFPYTLMYSPIMADDNLFAESFTVVLSNNLYFLVSCIF